MSTWIQLEYALSVEKHRHFGQAARACHVTQPTLSQQLQKLEDELAIILFDRTRKPILPTPEGQRFLDQAKIVMREQQKLLDIAKQSRSGKVSGEFRLAVIPTVASDLLPLFLKPFAKTFPDVQLHIEEMKTESILEELANDRLDAGILATPIERADVKVHPLYYEPFYVYLSNGHPLLKKAKLTRNDLASNQMWLLQDGHCFKDQVLSFCSVRKEQDPALGTIHFRSGNLDTLRRLVQKSEGFTLLPALMVESLRSSERDSHVRGFQSPVPSREISLVYRRDHWKLVIIRAIEDTIREHIPAALKTKPTPGMKVLDVP